MTRSTDFARRCRFPIFCLLSCFALTLGAASGWAVELGPSPQDRWVTKAVITLLDHGHLSQHKLDDEVSKRAFKNFLKTLDPFKRFFTQADVDEFSKWESEIDDGNFTGSAGISRC